MAYFAKLDNDNIVVEIHTINNQEMLDSTGNENEDVGKAFLINWSGGYTKWKQTSYNANFRKNFAGIGYRYDSNLDAFIPPKPYNTWTLDNDTATWVAPIQKPQDGNQYYWDPNINNWKQL